MNILIIDREFPPNPHGGIGSYDFALADQLARFNHRVVVLTISQSAKPITHKENFGTLIVMPYRPMGGIVDSTLRWLEHFRFSIYISRVVDRLLEENSIDIIEIPSAGGCGAFWGKRLQKKTAIYTRFHGALGKEPMDDNARGAYLRELEYFGKNILRFRAGQIINLPLWQLERTQLVQSRHITTPSFYSRDWLVHKTNISPNRMDVIQNGIDLEDLARILESHREPIGTHKQARKILFAGRCSISKGIGVFLRSLPILFKNESNCEIIFAGSQPDVNITRFLQEIDNKYPGRISYPGRIKHREMLNLMAECELLVHPTFYEVSSMVAIEAMGLGLPVIASDTGPLPEIVDNNKTGLLFEVGNSIALADAMMTLLSITPQKRQEIQQASIERANQLFDIRKNVARIIDVYSNDAKKESDKVTV